MRHASYFGTWANPSRLLIFNHCEGDTTLKEAVPPEEFTAEQREIDAWNGRRAIVRPGSTRGLIRR